MAKPTTELELKEWLDTHSDAGHVDGKPVILDGKSEFRYGTVPGDLYDRALLIAAPFGFNKSEIAAHGASRFLSNAIVNGAESNLIQPADCKDGTEFRAFLPTGLYNLVQDRKTQLGWTNSQMMVAILVYFAHDPGIEKIYQRWVKEFGERVGLESGELEKKVYDYRRYQARKKRYEMSMQLGRFVDDKKVPT